MNYQHEEKWTEELRTYGTVNKVNIRTGQQPYQHNPNLLRGRGNTNEEFIETVRRYQGIWRYIVFYVLDVLTEYVMFGSKTSPKRVQEKHKFRPSLSRHNSTGEVGKIDTYPTYIIRMNRIL